MAANEDIQRLQNEEDRYTAIAELHKAARIALEALSHLAIGHPCFARDGAESARKALGEAQPALDRLCRAHNSRKRNDLMPAIRDIKE